ncbi:LPS export ABC transporter permease LptF [Salinisphaera sp. T31B1]|uniref:LPS export ABC transporter permease LptF n=1 Tax=Salinisphaera sp. T31B1 TaxID=727963 RepID=UPI0033426C2A
MIADRSLLRAVAGPTLTVLLVLLAIFASYSVTRYLDEAAQGEQAMRLVGTLIGLRVLIALEVLLPLALFLGIMIGLGRLYADNEMIAWQAGGLSRRAMLRPIVGFAVLVAVLVGALSLFGRPWAYAALYSLEVQAETRLDLSAVTPRRFYSSDDAVIYAGGKSDDGQRLDDVFARFIDGGRPVIVRAAHLRRNLDADGAPTLEFEQGHLYQLDSAGRNDRMVGFGHMEWHLQPSNRVVGYKRKAASSESLLSATAPEDIAERQWRISRPFAALFLAVLAITLARSSPRSARALNIVAAAVSFAVYYGMASIARSWVEQGRMPVLPGIYWVDALVGVGALILLWRHRTSY